MADRDGLVQISSLDGRACLRLTSWLPEPAGNGVALTLAGRELPTQVGAVLPGALRMLCLGPGDWLIVSRERSAIELRERIESLLAAEGYSLVDLSDAFAGFEIQGSAARELLSKGSGLDFHAQSFVAGQCARTRFAGIPVVIECLDDAPRFELTVAKSYGQYLHVWLADAAVEFQALGAEALRAGG